MFTSRVSPVPQAKVILAFADLASVAGALFFAVLLRLGWASGLEYVQERALGFGAVSIAFPVVFYVCGLYDTNRLRSAVSALVPAALSVCLGVLLGGACFYLSLTHLVGRGIVVAFAITLFAAIVVLRWLYARVARSGVLSVRCLIIGTRHQASRVLDLLLEYPDSSLKIVGLVHCRDVRSAEPGSARDRDELAVLGDLDSLEAIVAEHRVERLIVATTLQEDPVLLRRLRPLRYRGVGLVDLVSLYEELAREIPVDHIDDGWLFQAATMNSRLHIRRLKRVIDVAGSLVLLVPAMLVLPLAALAVKVTSRGPVLFRQERVGIGSKPFMVLKLRTMYQDAEVATGPVWSTNDDPRITPVGRLLRKFRIDELPQLFNVLCGDMSLVGPRPERPVFVKKLSEAVPFYSERLLVRPGITGWAQVMAPYASTVGDSLRKLQFDLYYAKHMSLSLDLIILAKTVKTMLFGRERVQGGMVAGRQLEETPEPVRIGRAAGPGEVA